MKVVTKAVYQMTEQGLSLIEEQSFEYQGAVAYCGGGPSPQEKAAAQSQLELARVLQQLGMARERRENEQYQLIKPYATSRLQNGLPFFGALTDYAAGTNAQAFAPARAELMRRLGGFDGLPSGFREQMLADFEANRARGFDGALVNNLLMNEQAKSEAARLLTNQQQIANPLGYLSAAQNGFNPQQYEGMRSPGLGGVLGGLSSGVLSLFTPK